MIPYVIFVVVFTFMVEYISLRILFYLYLYLYLDALCLSLFDGDFDLYLLYRCYVMCTTTRTLPLILTLTPTLCHAYGMLILIFFIHEYSGFFSDIWIVRLWDFEIAEESASGWCMYNRRSGISERNVLGGEKVS